MCLKNLKEIENFIHSQLLKFKLDLSIKPKVVNKMQFLSSLVKKIK